MRTGILARVSIVAVRRIRQRRHWPKALLARVLGCGNSTVYALFPGAGWIDSADVFQAILQAKEDRRGAGDAAAPGRRGTRRGSAGSPRAGGVGRR